MESNTYWDTLLPCCQEQRVWELFHENSKLSPFDIPLSPEAVLERLQTLQETIEFHGYPSIKLPDTLLSLTCSLDEALRARTSCRELQPYRFSIEELATLLQYGYGVNGRTRALPFPRATRVVPSAGALYPLELFFYSACLSTLQPGVYHYHPPKHQLRFLRPGNHTATLAEMFVQSALVAQASLMVFIVGVFERSVFKYGERGYRYLLLEAGHVAQNLNLTATALGIASVNLGGFFDRRLDQFLDLDGVTLSTLYCVAFGQAPTSSSTDPLPHSRKEPS
ncbi:MAG: SagB/ThcOx family dehydrogenase [Nitrospirae bacterium]|nr:MAG: SagB/ThcOx family dehydrogenase [Nitrospirota bacterium]